MKIGRDKLRKILIEEACGCMAAEPALGYFEDSVADDSHHYQDEPLQASHASVDRDSVLNCVAVLAMSVECPVTREALLSTVYELMS